MDLGGDAWEPVSLELGFSNKAILQVAEIEAMFLGELGACVSRRKPDTLSLSTERGRKHKHQRETAAESVIAWAVQMVVHFVL